jgi:hypothetical protein
MIIFLLGFVLGFLTAIVVTPLILRWALNREIKRGLRDILG